MPRPYGKLTGRMAWRNKRPLESPEDCWVKMEFGQRGKKYLGRPPWAQQHQFKVSAPEQAAKPQRCLTSELGPNSWCLPLSPLPGLTTLWSSEVLAMVAVLLSPIYRDETVASDKTPFFTKPQSGSSKTSEPLTFSVHPCWTRIIQF